MMLSLRNQCVALSQEPLKVACKITLPQGRRPIYHLAVMVMSRRAGVTSPQKQKIPFEVKFFSLFSHSAKLHRWNFFFFFSAGLVTPWPPRAWRANSPVIALHNQIALWETDDFVSGEDNVEYDDQLNHV